MRRCSILILLSVAATRAIAQTPNPPLRVVPPPPMIAADAASGRPAHHATQSAIDPEHAFDGLTGDGYTWDCAKKSWINTKTKESIGFAGNTGTFGEIIPPPPLISGNQAQTTAADPDHAVEPKTGTNLTWDRDTKTWRDAKTNKDVGYLGVVLRDTCPSTHAVATVSVNQRPLAPLVFNEGTAYEQFLAGIHYDYRSFYKLKDVSSNSTLVTSNDVTSATNGCGGFLGGKLPGVPPFAPLTEYSSTVPTTNT